MSVQTKAQDALEPYIRAQTRIGVAVSGGGDSMALLALVHALAPSAQIFAATVDHKLRDTAAAEIDLVKAFCASKQIAWTCLEWQGWDHTG